MHYVTLTNFTKQLIIIFKTNIYTHTYTRTRARAYSLRHANKEMMIILQLGLKLATIYQSQLI